MDRFFEPFNTESRFYWPAVIAVGVSLVANIVWYAWRARGTPAELSLRGWAFWSNVTFLIWYLVLLRAQAPFWVFALSALANVALLVYMYRFYLPPLDAAWEREQRRQAFFPKPARRKRRHR